MSMWNYVSTWSAAEGDAESDNRQTSDNQVNAIAGGIDTLLISEEKISPSNTITDNQAGSKKKDSQESSSDDSFELVDISRISPVAVDPDTAGAPNLDKYRDILNNAMVTASTTSSTTTDPATSGVTSDNPTPKTVDQFTDFLITSKTSSSTSEHPAKPGYLTLAALSAPNQRSELSHEEPTQFITTAEVHSPPSNSHIFDDLQIGDDVTFENMSHLNHPMIAPPRSLTSVPEVSSSGQAAGYNADRTCPETIALCRKQVDLVPHLRTGTVKWFNPTRGFGFIIDKNGEEIFVHQTALKMNGFCYLRPGEKVMFTTRKRANRPREQVVDVIGSRLVNDTNFQRAKITGSKMYRCYNCGEFSDHMADTCPVPHQTKLCCYICLSDQHLRADCPSKNIPAARHADDVLVPMSHVRLQSLNETTTSAFTADSAYTSETSFGSDDLMDYPHQPPDPGILDSASLFCNPI